MADRGRIQLLPEAEAKFFTKAAELTIRFVKDDKDAVTELVLHQNGRDQTAKRVPPKPPETKEEKKDK